MDLNRIKESIEFLKTFNQWRRGAEIPQPNPTEIGINIHYITTIMDKLIEEHPEILEKLNTK